MNNYFIITGGPGSGKTAILSELIKHGIAVVPEFSRDILAEQRAIDGDGTYDQNPALFKELLLSRAIHDYKSYQQVNKTVFFDRGIPDVLAYADCFGLPIGAELNASNLFRYNTKVFFAPSWEEIYKNDEERQISFEEAKQFGDNLKNIYTTLGYEIIEIPRISPKKRADFIFHESRQGIL